MSSRTLYRLSGVALILGSSLLAIGYAMSSILLLQGQMSMYTDAVYVPAQMMQIYGAILLLMGLPGVGIRLAQAPKSKKVGFIGFVMTFLGIATTEAGLPTISAFIFPTLAAHPATQPLVIALNTHITLAAISWYLLGLVGTFAGSLLMGIAIVRSKVFPRLAGVMLIVVPPFGFFSLMDSPLIATITGIVFAVAFSVGLIWCGYGLVSDRKEEGVQSVLATKAPYENTLDVNSQTIVSTNHRNVEASKSL